MNALFAAIDLAERFGCFLIPLNSNKKPLFKTGVGHADAATNDLDMLRQWSTHPDFAGFGIVCHLSKLVVLDIDVRDEEGAHYSGWDSLENLGVNFSPETPMSHSPFGRGSHLYFRWPDGINYIKGAIGEHGLGRGLDIRASGNYVTAPPLGKNWDPHWNFDTVYPVAMPAWMHVPEREPAPTLNDTPRPAFKIELNPYAAAALDDAVRRIASAGMGEQRQTLNSEGYGIGRLVGAGELPASALDLLCWQARQIRNFDATAPWRPGEAEKVVREAFDAGSLKPRLGLHDRG